MIGCKGIGAPLCWLSGPRLLLYRLSLCKQGEKFVANTHDQAQVFSFQSFHGIH